MSMKFVLCLLLAVCSGLAVAKDDTDETVVYKLEGDSIEDHEVYSTPEYFNDQSSIKDDGSVVTQDDDETEDSVGAKREGAASPYPYYWNTDNSYYPMTGVKSSVALRADLPIDPVIDSSADATKPVNNGNHGHSGHHGHHGHPGHEHPGHGHPGHGHPGHGYPGHGYPGHGYPGHGYPGHGYPGHGYPGHGYPGHGHQHPYPYPGYPYPPYHFPGYPYPGFPYPYPGYPYPGYPPHHNPYPTHKPKPAPKPRPDSERTKICKLILPFGKVCTYTDGN